MKKEEILLTDWHRILFGNTPWKFLIETAGRTLLIYAFMLVVVRLLGKRMNSQATLTDMAVMITLGAIASVPMQTANVGLLQGAFILVLALVFHRGLNRVEGASGRIETITQGKVGVLVKDGVLQLDELSRASISVPQLGSVLRSKGVLNLAEVDRVYLEACGLFSIFRNASASPGLSLLPDSDQPARTAQPGSRNGPSVCARCGHRGHPGEERRPCPLCGAEEWQPAVHSESMAA